MAYKFGLKPKITITVSILFISLMSTVAYVMLSYFEKQLKATIAQNQFVLVTGLASEIDNRLTIVQSQLTAAALMIPPAALKDPDRAQAFLDSMIGLRRIFDSHVSILTPEGKIFAETPFLPGRRGFDISFRPYYKNTVATGQSVISDPYFSLLEQKNPLIRMTAPVFNEKGSLVGILSGAINLMGENILQDISHITIGRTGYLLLTTRDSRLLIMHPDAKRILTPLRPGMNLLFDKAVDGFEGTDEVVNSYGVRMLTSFKRLKVNNWILGANYPVSEAHEVILELKEKFFMATSFGIICVVSIVFFLVKHLTSSLVAFTRHIETLPEKTGAAKLIAVRTGDEIGTLSQAFNRMVGELDQQKDTLEKSEERYRTIYDSSNEAILIQDKDTGAILDVNQKLCEITGFTKEEARRVDVGVFGSGKPPYTLQNAMVWIAKAAQGEPQFFEWRAKHKSGHLFWVEVKMKCVEIDGADRILTTANDITQRKKAEEALRESERRLSQIIDFLPDATLAIDMNGTVIAWNHAIEKMTGVKGVELLGKGNYEHSIPFYGMRRPILLDLVLQPDEDVKKQYTSVRKEGDCILAEAEVTLKGTNHHLWAVARPLFDSSGNIVGAIESMRDITDRKRAEEEKALLEDKLVQAQKMEAVGVLAGGIAHDFNNILSAILGFTELAKRNNPANQQLQEDLGEVYTAGNRAKELVQQILIFSRKKKHNPYHLHVPTFVKEALKLLRSTLPASIEIKVDIDESVGLVLADPTHIHQIVMNLCTNAGHAMDKDGGILTIQVSETTPSDQFFIRHPNLAQGNYIKLVVQDTGSGIAPEIMDSIFDPYFTTKNYGDGTGLGLAVTYGIIQEIGGDITAESEPGKGSIFTVLLPVSTQEAKDTNISDSFDYSRSEGNERILLVDDEPQILKFTKTVLTFRGYTVTTAKDGQSALEVFKHNPLAFDLVISDVSMPKLTGDKLALQILAIRPTMPILLASGYSQKISEESVVQIGVRGLLTKPVSEEHLLRKIRQIFDQT